MPVSDGYPYRSSVPWHLPDGSDRILTGAEVEDHYQAVIKGGTRWGLTGVGGGADRASRAHEDRQFDRDLDGRWNDQNLEHQLGLDDQDHKHHPNRPNLSESLSSRDKLVKLLKDKKYEIVLGSWAASMIGSFGLVAAQPMPFTQKLVQARMYAQSLTVAMILASAGLTSMANFSSNDETSEQALRTNSMYKFKKGSPHELREQQLKDAKMSST
ncbi:hypothetical protein VP01_3956g1 [Puccinia sorghi]|uniref:HIG1 domain-containing protein n=1 Tax=Puccinia sorghi TaxID=27349 RepID=A0A0L6UUB1_9BASI|nr:hypothetical protein VP01_3956g1 [Puccinia sorghi]